MEKLILEGVSKCFAADRVVDEVSLSIEPGEFVALLGPSGCGKTTILRLLAGFETLSGGTIRLGARPLAGPELHLPPELRQMGMVFQSYALWPHMTVAENVGYPLKLKRVAPAEYRRRVDEALEAVQLTAYAGRAPRDLSGGQRQRVALARCLVSEPAVVLLDEPLANLDRHLRASMEEAFRAFHRRTGATMIYVTHDQGEAMSLASRIAVMQKGQLVQWSTPEQLYRYPRTPWIAGFIGQGSIAQVAGLAAGIGASNAVDRELGGEALQRGLSDLPGARTPVLIRPQDVRIGERGVPGRITESVFRGERYELKLALYDGTDLLAYHDAPLPLQQWVGVEINRGWVLEADR